MSYEALLQGYQKICGEFKEFYAIARQLVKKDAKEKLIRGYAILYSDLIYKPDFLFIGINPNAGDPERGWKAEDLEIKEQFEYVDMEDNGDSVNSLSWQTRELFKQTKFYDQFVKAMKINLFYYATRNVKDFDQVTTILNKDNINPYAYSIEWTKRLIGLIQPKVIFCEGVRVHNLLQEYYNEKLAWNGSVSIGSLGGSIKVVSYKRRWSQILDKESVAVEINKLIL